MPWYRGETFTVEKQQRNEESENRDTSELPLTAYLPRTCRNPTIALKDDQG